ncbi:uncharacterized protein METZ01_LOCUS461978 [marine metagenome]|uniref:Uncharacterized protein n=1 Tax=marine metagenome TaxID=408172 RepID=A0A383AN61_9ZZZZ
MIVKTMITISVLHSRRQIGLNQFHRSCPEHTANQKIPAPARTFGFAHQKKKGSA